MPEIMATEADTPESISRPLQRIERMKLKCNQLVDRINDLAMADQPKLPAWKAKYFELVQEIEITELEIAAKLLRKKPGGVNINVPITKFTTAVGEPEVNK